MNKKILLFLVLFSFLLVSSVSALSLLAYSQVDFESNNDDYSGPAFVIATVENGGQDTINWDIFEDSVSDGYEVDKSGSITSNFHSYGYKYPTQMGYTLYEAVEIDSKFYLNIFGSLNGWIQDWCYEQGGDLYMSKTNGNYYSCIRIQPRGTQYYLMDGEYKWDVDYNFKIYGEGTDTITITDTSRTNGKTFGDKRWFNVVKQTSGIGATNPQLDKQISLFWDKKSYSWIVIDDAFIDYNLRNFYTVKNDLLNCPDQLHLGGDYALGCIERHNDKVNGAIASVNKPNLDIVGNKNDFDQGKGSVIFDDGRVYENPIATLTINADKITVYREFGELDIVDVDYPDDITVGKTYPITIRVKEEGIGDADAEISYNCNDVTLQGFGSPIGFDKGETKSLDGTITFSGNTQGCSDRECYLYVKNRNAVGTDDTYKINYEVCPSDSCPPETSTCFGNILRVCTKSNGVWSYSTGKLCDNGCEIDGQTAYCKGEVGYCGDNICGLNEDGVKETVESCREDCYIPDPNGDNILIIFGIVGGVVLILAFVLRLKKDGYFDK